MKKIKTTFIITLAHLLICTSLMAQAPQGFEYQAVVRNASGNILVSQSVGLQITLKQGSPSGTNVYQETFSTITNLYGLVNLQIGSGTTIDDFTTIDWATGPYFIEVALDVTGGTSYSVMGTSQLLSVPYALHAKTVEVDNIDDADNDPANEIELPATANVGDVLTWNGTNWVASPKNGGKTYLILSGDITDSEAIIKIAEEAGPNTQFIMIQNTTNLTTVDLSWLTESMDLRIENNTNLTNVLTPNLTTIFGNTQIYGNTNLTNIDFPLLEKIFGNFSVSSNTILTSLSAPALTTAKEFFVNVNPALTSLSIPTLTTIVNEFSVNNNVALTSLSIPSLTTTSYFSIYTNSALTSLSAPALTTVTLQFSVSSNAALTLLSAPALTTVNQFSVNTNALPSTEINVILAQLVAINPPLTTSYIDLSNQTPLAPPTGQGITDKNTLISNGNTVITD